LGLEVIADKPESQEICFVPDGDYMKILRERLPADAPALSRGPIVMTDGAVIGEHDGFARYTIGQRRGLPGGFAEPVYVVAIRPEERAVVVGSREELLGNGVIARETNWISDPPAPGASVQVRVRHRAPLVTGELLRVEDGEIEIALDAPVAAITPGQSLAVYNESGMLLGGAFIDGARQSTRVLRTIAA
ncbi:MAG: aminomethyltransferase beta-barrel domain-containing protein, partial [Gemmatimonadaceae bacterium]